MPTTEQITALRAVARACLEVLSWDNECPVCGEDWHVDGHDDECELVALMRVYPEINRTGHEDYWFVGPERLRTNGDLQELKDAGG